MHNPLIPFDTYISQFTEIVLSLREETKMSLINKIEEEFALLRQFLVSTLGDHIHIHSGVDGALDAVKAAVREDAASQLVAEGQARGEYNTANPAASEVPEASPAPPSAPVTEEVPTPAQPSDFGK